MQLIYKTIISKATVLKAAVLEDFLLKILSIHKNTQLMTSWVFL